MDSQIAPLGVLFRLPFFSECNFANWLSFVGELCRELSYIGSLFFSVSVVWKKDGMLKEWSCLHPKRCVSHSYSMIGSSSQTHLRNSWQCSFFWHQTNMPRQLFMDQWCFSYFYCIRMNNHIKLLTYMCRKWRKLWHYSCDYPSEKYLLVCPYVCSPYIFVTWLPFFLDERRALWKWLLFVHGTW